MHYSLKKITLFLILFLLFPILSINTFAATVTWSGGGTDNLASSPANWLGSIVPQDGDDVLFDGTSSKDCTWDITLTLSAVTMNSDYNGQVTLSTNATLVIAKNLDPPASPSGLGAATISSSEINLSWVDNSNNESGFKIERKTGSGGAYAQIATVGIDEAGYHDTGLAVGTTYFYKVKAYNSFGDSGYSDETSAATLSVAQPTVTTDPATDIGGSYTTLNATVNPNGDTATAYFQWGTDISYGNTTTIQSIGNGTSDVNVTESLTGLSASTTYHYRIVADNAGGTSYGSDISFTTPGWFDIDWLYRQKVISRQQVTIDNAISPTVDLYEFPILLKTTDQTNSIFDKAMVNGNDIVFTLDDGLTRLDHEIEYYNNSTGNKELIAWVKIPVLTSSSDTIIYMYYGNSSAFDQQNTTDVWDSNFKGVWHLSEEWPGTGTADLYEDSTGNNNDGEDKVSATGKNGQIGSGQEFDGVGDYIDIADSTSLDISDKITIEAWVYLESNTGYREMLVKGNGTYVLYFDPGTTTPVAGIYQSDYVSLSFGTSINLNEWTYLSFTYDKDGGSDNLRTYINGDLASTSTITGPIATDDYSFNIGAAEYWETRDVYVDGFIDEVRISDVNRSDEWIKAAYNNQNRQDSDLTFGEEENYINQVSPTVLTDTATNITGSSATLNATVTPNGSDTTAYFQWGTDTSYGNTTSAQSIGKGADSVNVTENISGLTPGMTYHYRLVADNDIGTSYGDDITFTTESVITWTGLGADDLATNSANWAGGIAPQNGDDIIFDGTSNCIWNISVSPRSLTMLSAYTGTITVNMDLSATGNLTIAGGTLNLDDNNLNVYGFLMILPAGTLNATSSTITVKGDWANWGSFISGTSTVVLNGTYQTVYGNTTFNNLIKIVTSADTLYFDADSIQTISNSLTLQGAESNLLSLRSTSDGMRWYLDPQGTRNMSFVSVKDLKNKSHVNIIGIESENSGNNEGVSFGGEECVCKKKILQYGRVLFNDWRQSC